MIKPCVLSHLLTNWRYDLQVGDGEYAGISPNKVGKTLCSNSENIFGYTRSIVYFCNR